jgi:ligand-binding sensor domain-containing protein/signal transduction histidine kinase
MAGICPRFHSAFLSHRVLLFLGLFGLTCCAWALNPAIPAGSYAIQGWFAEDGLPSSRVRSVHQARDGYIWLATSQGIARFDGFQFKVWTQANTRALTSSNFYQIEEEPDGALWFASAIGLYRYHNGSFDRFGVENGLLSSYIRTVYRLRDGTILLGTDRGVSVMRDGKVIAQGAWKMPTGAVRTFIQRRDGSVFAGGREGLWCVVGDHAKKLSGTASFPDATFTAFAEEQDGRLWIGCNRDLRCLYPDGHLDVIGAAQGLTSRSVESLYIDRDGVLWVGTAGGLFRVRNGRAEFAAYPAQFGASLIGEMCETREGALWVSSNAGVFQLRETPAHGVGVAEGLQQSVVVTMLDTQDGAWWIGLWSGGVYRYEEGRASPVAAFSSVHGAVFYTMLEDPDGTLWIGGDAGLYRQLNGVWTNLYLGRTAGDWLKKLNAQPDIELPGLVHNRVNSIVADGEGGHWVATLGALYRLQPDGHARIVPTTLGQNIRAVYRTKSGDVWATPQIKGALRLHEGAWKMYGPADGLGASSPRSIYEDSTGTIWLCSVTGVSRFKQEHWHFYSAKNGLADQVNSVIEDQYGFLWFGTPQGVMRVARSDFDELDAGRIATVRAQSINRRDGMPDSECVELGSPNAWSTRSGLLLFPTNGGVAVIDPRAIRVNNVPPPVQIESVAVAGVMQPNAPKMEFAPGSRDIEIHFSGASFLEPERVRFKVRLAPLDTAWVDVGGRHDIRYPRLPPGDYDFHVIACNNHGVWNETGARLEFRVRPFFYQTPWFVALVVLLLGGIGVGAFRWRVRRLHDRAAELQAQNAELERRVAERTATLAQRSAELADASRLAGMAEVATGVLHNVGNVLNSVNTSASLVADGISKLRTPSLVKVASLLAENGNRLGDFFSTDPRAQKLPAYLTQLAEHLEHERDSTSNEVRNLLANVEHIKEIVVAQQGFARATGVIEVIPPTKLIELAIGISESAFTRHAIAITRDFASVPPVRVERPKVLQILVNLLRNAKESIVEAAGADRKLTVTLQLAADGLVEIRVIDTGLGIARENLSRVFAFGFTTKKGGHGFGLHSSALAAKELGGSLEAFSNGLGCGAMFVLRLPAASAAPATITT